MNIWFFVWLIATLVLLYFVGWTFLIIFKQRKTWKAFAEKHALRYETPTSTSSPQIEGVYQDYTISLFTSEHDTDTRRGVRKLTAMECLLKSKPVIQGAVANGNMRLFLKNTLGYAHEISIDHKDWTPEFMAVSPQGDAIKTYLTDERIVGLTALGNIKNAWITLVFYKETALLRIDLPDALANEKKLMVLVNKMVKVAQSLELTDDEIKRFQTDQTPEPETLPASNQTDM